MTAKATRFVVDPENCAAYVYIARQSKGPTQSMPIYFQSDDSAREYLADSRLQFQRIEMDHGQRSISVQLRRKGIPTRNIGEPPSSSRISVETVSAEELGLDCSPGTLVFIRANVDSEDNLVVEQVQDEEGRNEILNRQLILGPDSMYVR